MECGRKVQEVATNIKVNIYKIKNMDMVFFHGPLVTFTKEIMKKTYELVLGRCIGMMEVIIRVNGRMEFNMAKVTCI